MAKRKSNKGKPTVRETKGKKPPNGRTRGRPVPLPPDDPAAPPPGPAAPLNEEERNFVDEWAVDRHQSQAYRRTHPAADARTARIRGSEMAARPHVRAEMLAVRRAQRLRCRVEADQLVEEMCRIAFSDVLELFDDRTGLLRTPRQIPLETRKAITSIKVSRERRTVVTAGSTRTTITDSVIEYRFWNKGEGITRLAELLGLRTSLPPLDALLALLPAPLQAAVRAAMAAPAPLPAAPPAAIPLPAPPPT